MVGILTEEQEIEGRAHEDPLHLQDVPYGERMVGRPRRHARGRGG